MNRASIDWEHIKTLPFIGLESGMELRQDSDGVIVKVPHATSWSRGETFLKSRSLYHGRHLAQTIGREDADHLRLGTLVHLAVLEPDRFESEVVESVTVKRNTGAGKAAHQAMAEGKSIIKGPCAAKNHKAWKLWTAEEDLSNAVAVLPKDYDAACEGLEILRAMEGKQTASPQLMDTVRTMADRVLANDHAAEILNRPGFAEREVHWTDEETGIEIFAHPDWTCQGIVADVKTTPDPSLESFARSIEKWGYARQAALYTGGAYREIARAEGWPEIWPAFYHLCVGSAPPHDVCVYELSTEWIERGRDQIYGNHVNVGSLNRLRQCLDADDWRLPESKILHTQQMPGYIATRDLIPMTVEDSE